MVNGLLPNRGAAVAAPTRDVRDSAAGSARAMADPARIAAAAKILLVKKVVRNFRKTG
jgi:hypothetical protein